MLTAAALAALAAWLAFPDPTGRGGHARRADVRAWIRRRVPRPSIPSPDVAAALSALAAELSAGRDLDAALLACRPAARLWPRAIAAAEVGGDVASALVRDDARALAACWRVAGSSGAGLAAAISGIAAGERDATSIRARLAGELAAPRASARMLAALPLVGIAMGIVMGAEPLDLLLGSWPGRGLLVVAGLLTIGGLLWTGAIVRSVERLL